MDSDILLQLTNVSKQYQSRSILSGLGLTIRRGDCVLVRGKNGCGKSTLLKVAAGLLALGEGERRVRATGLKVGYAPDVLPRLRMTSHEYLWHMGKIAAVPKAELREKIQDLHSFFRLEASDHLKMSHFSKGMLQKVNLMQALIRRPDLLILDEPFSGLDAESTAHLLAGLQGIHAAGTAILAAVHDPLALEDWRFVRTYRLEAGKLKRESVQQPAQEEAMPVRFEIICMLEPAAVQQLARECPDVIGEQDEQGRMKYVLQQKHYRIFILALTRLGGIMVHLQREERSPCEL